MAKIKCMTVKNKFITTFLDSIAGERFTAIGKTCVRRLENGLVVLISPNSRMGVLLDTSVDNDIVTCPEVRERIKPRMNVDLLVI